MVAQQRTVHAGCCSSPRGRHITVTGSQGRCSGVRAAALARRRAWLVDRSMSLKIVSSSRAKRSGSRSASAGRVCTTAGLRAGPGSGHSRHAGAQLPPAALQAMQQPAGHHSWSPQPPHLRCPAPQPRGTAHLSPSFPPPLPPANANVQAKSGLAGSSASTARVPAALPARRRGGERTGIPAIATAAGQQGDGRPCRVSAAHRRGLAAALAVAHAVGAAWRSKRAGQKPQEPQQKPQEEQQKPGAPRQFTGWVYTNSCSRARALYTSCKRINE